MHQISWLKKRHTNVKERLTDEVYDFLFDQLSEADDLDRAKRNDISPWDFMINVEIK